VSRLRGATVRPRWPSSGRRPPGWSRSSTGSSPAGDSTPARGDQRSRRCPGDHLEKFDVYTNFPHLAWVAGSLDLTDDQFKPWTAGSARRGDRGPLRAAARHLLRRVPLHGGRAGRRRRPVTWVNRCFRNEDHYEGLRRLASFQDARDRGVGSYDHTQQCWRASPGGSRPSPPALGLDLGKCRPATPFFRNDNGRALLQKLSPSSTEFQYGSWRSPRSTPRNFFGERCGIRLLRASTPTPPACLRGWSAGSPC